MPSHLPLPTKAGASTRIINIFFFLCLFLYHCHFLHTLHHHYHLILHLFLPLRVFLHLTSTWTRIEAKARVSAKNNLACAFSLILEYYFTPRRIHFILFLALVESFICTYRFIDLQVLIEYCWKQLQLQKLG